jgi:hypothetical protein
MSTNQYFNNYTSAAEQTLVNNLIIESIKMYGIDMYYCPRTIVEKDEIYGESPIHKYQSNHAIEMYIKNVDGFEGDGHLLSKFGLEIRDQITFSVAQTRFATAVGTPASILRPNEGDIIYFPLNQKVFVVKYTDRRAIFYQFGTLQTYDLTCEVFEYSSERLNTGLAGVDNIERDYSLATTSYALYTNDSLQILDADGYPILQSGYNFSTQAGDSFEDNTEIELEADGFIDFSETDPFSEGRI